jgi:hypothetical protein
MAALSLRLTKRAGEEYILTCVRPDGTVARQHYRGATARFFPRHDLAHYAVETELALARGFYGMVASGWSLGDFGAPWPRGPMPEDMDPVEQIVGLLDRETGRQAPFRADDFKSMLAKYAAEHPLARRVPELTNARLDKIRAQIEELYARWRALPVDATMELAFALVPSGELC